MISKRPGVSVFSKRSVSFLFVALALGIAWRVKLFYSQAGADELLWILTPTTWIASWLTGISFELEPGRGYLGRTALFEVIPACAGVNFMIVTFCSLCCALLPARPRVDSKLLLLVLSGITAYGTTLLANAVRLAVVIPIHLTRPSFGPVGPDRLHTIAGVVVYFLFLCVVFDLSTRIIGARRDHAD